jgi:hypothetical protein
MRASSRVLSRLTGLSEKVRAKKPIFYSFLEWNDVNICSGGRLHADEKEVPDAVRICRSRGKTKRIYLRLKVAPKSTPEVVGCMIVPPLR